MRSPSTSRVVIVDGDALTRLGLCAHVRSLKTHSVCGEAADAPTARKICERELPDLVVIGLPLPGAQEFGLVHDLVQAPQRIGVVALVVDDDLLQLSRILHAGCHAIVHRRDAPQSLREAFARVGSGRRYASEHADQAMLAALADGRHSRRAPRFPSTGDAARLSEQELNVFEMLGERLTPKDTAERLGRSIKTVETHFARIKEKLGVRTIAELRDRAEQWLIAHRRRRVRY